MAYDDDRRYGHGYRGRPRGYDDDRYRGGEGRYRGDDRGMFDRAGDEVRSWFGDEEAERRRMRDERRDPDTMHWHREPWGSPYGGVDDHRRGWNDDDYNHRGRGRGWDDHRDTELRSGSSAAMVGAGLSGRRRFGSYDYDANTHNPHAHDEHYSNWRREQIRRFDEDYAERQRRREQDDWSWRRR